MSRFGGNGTSDATRGLAASVEHICLAARDGLEAGAASNTFAPLSTNNVLVR